MWLECVCEGESIYREVKWVMARCLCVCVVVGRGLAGLCQKLGFYSVCDKHPLGDSEQGNNKIKNVLGKSFWLLSWEQTERSANADCKVIAKIHREADDSLDPESSSGDGTKRLDS